MLRLQRYAALIVAALVVAACVSSTTVSQDTSEPTKAAPTAAASRTAISPTATAVPSATAVPNARPDEPEPASKLIELLSAAPYDGWLDDTRMVNVELLFETNGFDHAQACSITNGDDFMQQYDGDNRSRTIEPLLFSVARRSFDELPIAFGFDYCEIDSYLHDFGTEYYVWVDKNDQDIADQAVQNPEPTNPAVISTVGDFTTVDWGDELDFGRMTALQDPGARLVISDHVVAQVNRAEAVDHVIDPNRERVIDRPHVRSIVEQLEARGTHTILLSANGTALPPRLRPGSEDLLDDATVEKILAGPLLEPWVTLGYGSAVSDEFGDVAVVVIGHASAAEAELNKDRFPEVIENALSVRNATPWSDRLTLVDIETDGLLMIATLISANETHPFVWVNVAHGLEDNLLIFEYAS